MQWGKPLGFGCGRVRVVDVVTFRQHQLLTTLGRDPGLDTPLDLRGEPLFVDDTGHLAKFVKVRTYATPERQQGLSYSFTLHAPDDARLVGFDMAPAARERRRSPEPSSQLLPSL